MKFRLVFLGVLIVIVKCVARSKLDEFTKGNHQFTTDLYNRLVKGRQDKNFVFSPLSIAITLALARLGANGKSADEITEAVGLPRDNSDLLQSLEHVSNVLKSDQFKFCQRVGLYTNEDVKVKDSFKTKLKSFPDANLEYVNFADIAKAIAYINRWVQVETKHKIKNLLTEDDICKTTQLILINAVYFSATWKHQFTMLPAKKRFRMSRTKSKLIEMMTVTNYFRYYDLDQFDAKAIELPYEGKDASMVIVLPNKDLGYHSAIDSNLKEIIEITSECKHNCSIRYTSVEIPLFTVWARFTMLGDFNQLGIRTPFSDHADFGNMVDGRIKLQNVVQKAFLNVTTEGATAAGAPASVDKIRRGESIELRALVDETKFEVNHGSVFFIKVHDLIILAGKLSHDDGFH